MIPKTVWILFLALLGAESRPFYYMNDRRTRDSQTAQNVDGAHPLYYPLLAFPVQQSSGMVSDFSSVPIHRPSLQFSNMLKRDRKNKILPSGSLDEDLQHFDRRTAQMVDQFGQRVRGTIRQYEKAQGQRMHKVGDIFDQFKLGEVKDRLKKTLMGRKELFNKLHSIGWRGKYIGVPYDTMNEDHVIVKKPGADSSSYSQPNAGIPVPVLVDPTIQLNPVQHPALPEVTTSVDFHQESKPTDTIDGYVFSITLTPTDGPEVAETAEISNSIDRADRLTITNTTTSTERIILEEDTDEIPDVVFIPANESSVIEDEKNNDSTISPETTTEFYATIFTSPPIETISETETTSQTTTLADVTMRIQVEPITSLTTHAESGTNEIGPTFPSTITIVDEENTSLKIDGYTTATEFITTFPSTFFTETTPGVGETTSPASKTTTITEIDFTNTTRDRKTTSDVITTTPSIFPTEEPIVTDVIFTAVDAAYNLVIDRHDIESTTEIVPTFSLIISTQSTPWPTPDSVTPVVDVLSTSGYNISPNVGSTFSVAIPTETTTSKIDREEIIENISTLTEETEALEEMSTTAEPVYNSFTTDGEIITNTVSTLTGTISTETNSWQPISSGVESTILSTTQPTEMSSTVTERLTTIDSGEMTTTWEETSTTSSTIDPGKTTEGSSTIFEESTTLDTAIYDSSIEIDIRNLETVSTFSTTIATQATTIPQDIPLTPNPLYDSLTIDRGKTTDIVSPFFHTVPIETTLALNESSTTTESQVDSMMIEEGTTAVTTTFPVTVPTEVTTTSGPEMTTGLDVLTRFENNYLTSPTIEEETTTVVDSTFFSTNPIESFAIGTERLTTVDSGFDRLTIDIQSTTDTASTLQSMTSIDETTTLGEVPAATTDPHHDFSTIDAETTTEILFPFAYTIPTGTTMAFDELSTTTTESLIESSTIDEKTTEVTSTFPVTVPTEVTATSGPEITTVLDVLTRFENNYLTSPTIEGETTTVVDSTFFSTNPIESFAIGTERLTTVDSGFDRLTIDIQSTTDTASTLQSMTPTDETTPLGEVPAATTDPYHDFSTKDAETTTEILFPFAYTIPTETTMAFDELSTTTTEPLIDSSNMAEETTEVTSTFPVTVPTETTTPSALEITTFSEVLPRFEDNYLTSSTINTESTTELVSTVPSTVIIEEDINLEEGSTTTDLSLHSSTSDTGKTYTQVTVQIDEMSTTTKASTNHSFIIDEGITTEFYSTFSVTIPTEVITREIETTTIEPELDSSTTDIESTSGIVSTFSIPISTEKTTTLESISAATDLPLESFTIDEETTTVIIPTETTTTSLEDVSNALDMGVNSVTDDGETATEIVSTFTFTISTEASVEPASEYDIEARGAVSEDLEGNDIPVLPEFARAAIEEPDVKSLLNLIPLIIEELRKNNLTTEEEYTLSKVFGNLWPLLEEESKRKPEELVNHKLAMLLLEAGHQLSNTDRPETYGY